MADRHRGDSDSSSSRAAQGAALSRENGQELNATLPSEPQHAVHAQRDSGSPPQQASDGREAEAGPARRRDGGSQAGVMTTGPSSLILSSR